MTDQPNVSVWFTPKGADVEHWATQSRDPDHIELAIRRLEAQKVPWVTRVTGDEGKLVDFTFTRRKLPTDKS